MMRDRRAEHVWLTLLRRGEASTPDEVARVAGLEPLGRAWITVDQDRAQAFLTAILHRDLAYKSEVMPKHTATWLASEFLASCGKFNSKYAINSVDLPDECPFTWTPATEYTLDAGVVVLGDDGCALYWVADED